MNINSDLHIHSKYSAATSKNMDLQTIAVEAHKKGIQLIGTGDCLHQKWLEKINQLEEEEGVYKLKDTLSHVLRREPYFILTVEIEDKNRVHHLLILPEISKAEELYESLRRYSNNINSDGRPNVNLNGVEIAEYARDSEALIGPSHAFTPWTALYAYFDSLKDCYGELTKYVSFVELGLSADSDYADRIKELQNLTFLTNSDAHSPWLNKFAREFNRFEVDEISFSELKNAILRKKGRKPILNVGFFPEEGKYNESACIKCYTHYTFQECLANKLRCPCGGLIKKGVKDRINELATFETPIHPEHRPPYLHLIPLSEIITQAIGLKSPNTKGVQTIWNDLIKRHGSEISVLVDVDTSELKTDERVLKAIKAFRNGTVIIHPGGGGQYGKVELEKNSNNKIVPKPQSSLEGF